MLAEQRQRIDAIDKEIVRLFEERMAVVVEVAQIKKENQMPILDEKREEIVYQKVASYLSNAELSESLKKVYHELMAVSKVYQLEKMDEKRRNEMMDRPIIQQNIVAYLRENQRQFSGLLHDIQKEANEKRVPIIPHETALFLDFLLGQLKPTKILEIGTAVGFSGLLMANHLPEHGELHTIDRFDVMIKKAKENFAKSADKEKITLLEGEAEHLLPTLSADYYDMIFMDSAKAKYYTFLPECLRVLKKGGILIVDDVFQAGTIFQEESTIPKRSRKIHRELKKFMLTVNTDPALKTTTLPLGDGVVLIEKVDK